MPYLQRRRLTKAHRRKEVVAAAADVIEVERASMDGVVGKATLIEVVAVAKATIIVEVAQDHVMAEVTKTVETMTVSHLCKRMCTHLLVTCEHPIPLDPTIRSFVLFFLLVPMPHPFYGRVPRPLPPPPLRLGYPGHGGYGRVSGGPPGRMPPRGPPARNSIGNIPHRGEAMHRGKPMNRGGGQGGPSRGNFGQVGLVNNYLCDLSNFSLVSVMMA